MKNLRKYTNQFLCMGLLVASYFFATLSSPLFPTNPWVDTNAMLTIGRAWLNGVVPFRDLFEQRGPTMYLIYMLAAWIHSNGFFGVFLLQISAGFIGYFFLVKLTKLFLKNSPQSYWIALIAFSQIIASAAFQSGGSPEEFVAPFSLSLLYLIIKRLNTKTSFTLMEIFWQGFALAFVFWIKYSLIGMWVGFFLFIGFSLLIQKRWQTFFKTTMTAFGGFFAVSLPILIYYQVVGGLRELIDDYFIVNLSSYTTQTQGLQRVTQIFMRMVGNASPHVIGVSTLLLVAFFVLKTTKLTRKDKGMLATIFFFSVFMVYFTGRPYYYYFLALTPFASVGTAVFFGRFFSKKCVCRYYILPIVIVCTLSMTTFQFKNRIHYGNLEIHSIYPITRQFAEAMRIMKTEKSINMLQIGFLDMGFYLAAQTIPTARYFANTNIPHANFPQLIRGQLEEVKKKNPEFVVLTSRKLPAATFTRFALEHQEAFTKEYIPKILLKNYRIINQVGSGFTGYYLFQRR